MKKIVEYLITLFIGLLLSFFISLSKDIFDENNIKDVYHILCDSFFVSGVLMSGLGLLVFVSSEGVFDGVIYVMLSFINLFVPKQSRKYTSFYDYKESKKKSKNSRVGFILVSGLILIVIAIIMYLLYRKY